jgi:uncharacterized protein
LLSDDDLLVIAPYGLEDLFAGRCRHNPARVSAAFYEQRLGGQALACALAEPGYEHAQQRVT